MSELTEKLSNKLASYIEEYEKKVDKMSVMETLIWTAGYASAVAEADKIAILKTSPTNDTESMGGE